MDGAEVVRFLHLLTRNTMAHFFLTQRHPVCVTKLAKDTELAKLVVGVTSLPCTWRKEENVLWLVYDVRRQQARRHHFSQASPYQNAAEIQEWKSENQVMPHGSLEVVSCLKKARQELEARGATLPPHFTASCDIIAPSISAFTKKIVILLRSEIIF